MPVTIDGSGEIGGLSAFQQGAGLTLIAVQAFTAASSVSVDDCFTSAYDNYRVEFYCTQTSANVTFRLRAAGADNTASTYNWNVNYTTSWGSTGAAGGVPNANVFFGLNSGTDWHLGLDVLRPALAAHTGVIGGWSGTPDGGSLRGIFKNTTVFDGISFIGTSMTGTLRVYGYTNGA